MGLFRRKPKKAELQAKVEELDASLVRSRNAEQHYKQRLSEWEESFPLGKRALVRDQLIPVLRAVYKDHLDWRAPVIPQEDAERQIRRLLAEYDAAGPNIANAVGARPK